MYKAVFQNSKFALIFALVTIFSAVSMVGTSEDSGLLVRVVSLVNTSRSQAGGGDAYAAGGAPSAPPPPSVFGEFNPNESAAPPPSGPVTLSAQPRTTSTVVAPPVQSAPPPSRGSGPISESEIPAGEAAPSY
jgi:hypothetical protein